MTAKMKFKRAWTWIRSIHSFPRQELPAEYIFAAAACLYCRDNHIEYVCAPLRGYLPG